MKIIQLPFLAAALTATILGASLLWPAPGPASGGPLPGTKISLQSASVAIGETVTVALEAFATPPGIAVYIIDVEYPEGLLTVMSCAAPPNAFCDDGRAPNAVRFTGASTTGATGRLSLGSITFRAGDNHCEATLRVHVRLLTESTLPIVTITAAVNDAVIRIMAGPASRPSGDVNCDGGADSIDAALVLQQDAGLIEALPFSKHGDVNEDGKIDSTDAALILQFTAGLLNSLPS